MKIIFDKKGYNFIEINREDDKIYITISAQDEQNLRKTLVSSVELNIDEFKNLISDIKMESKLD